MSSAMQVDEDAGALAKAATVDLNHLFNGIQFQEVEELGLAGAQPLSSVRSLSFASRPTQTGCTVDGPQRAWHCRSRSTSGRRAMRSTTPA